MGPTAVEVRSPVLYCTVLYRRVLYCTASTSNGTVLVHLSWPLSSAALVGYFQAKGSTAEHSAPTTLNLQYCDDVKQDHLEKQCSICCGEYSNSATTAMGVSRVAASKGLPPLASAVPDTAL